MKLTSTSITEGQRVPARYAMGKADPDQHATFSDNISPQLAWSDFPPGTKSFAIVMHDDSVPIVTTDVNIAGKTLSADLARTDFFHWILIDLDPSVTEILEAGHSHGITIGGKS